MAEVELSGWEDLIKNMDALPARMQKNILRGAMRNGANIVAAAIKDGAPVLAAETRNPHDRYPGQLLDAVEAVSLNPQDTPGAVAAGVHIRGSREALQSTEQAGRALNRGKFKVAAKAIVAAGASAFYWRWEEYGSEHNQPRPFIRQGWDNIKPGILQRIADYCQDRLDKITHD